MKKWEAKWITSRRFHGLQPINHFHKQNILVEKPTHDEALKNHHMLVRKTFQFGECQKPVYIDITADDYYKLHINGRFVAQGPAPGYPFHYYYNHLDITPFICTGTNVIAVHLYYQGLVNRVWCSGDNRQGLIAEIYNDESVFVKTDHTWRYIETKEYTGGGIFGYDTQFVENIDNRKKITGWRDVAFNDAVWLCCMENEEDDHTLYLQPTPPVDGYEIQPETISILNPGHYLLDFGKELTGHLKMKASGKNGDTIEIMYGEELTEEGQVRYDMRCNCFYKDIWTLAEGMNELEPFEYKAFRYAQVKAPSKAVAEDSIRAVVRHYPMDDGGCRFISSNAALNAIWEICKNGVRLGCQEVYVDCPSREKGQYLGDATVTALSQIYLTGDLRLFKKHLTDFAVSSQICPGLMAVAPCSYMQEIADFSLLWPTQLLTYYLHSNDRDFLEEMLPVAEGIVRYFKNYEREDGLLENVKEKWNLVDWPEGMRDGYDFDLSTVVGDGCHNVINALYLGAVKTVDQLRAFLQLPQSNAFEGLKESFIRAFFREQSNLFADSTVSRHCAIHSNIFPLFYDLAPVYAHRSIVALIRNKGLACGVFNAFFLLKGLARVGEYDLVYQLMTSDAKHSWRNMLGEGASACFEAWGKDFKWNTSLCHPWASAPIPVLIEDILGLSPKTPGWETFHFKPHIPAELEALELEMTTKCRKIRVSNKNGKTEITTELLLK